MLFAGVVLELHLNIQKQSCKLGCAVSEVGVLVPLSYFVERVLEVKLLGAVRGRHYVLSLVVFVVRTGVVVHTWIIYNMAVVIGQCVFGSKLSMLLGRISGLVLHKAVHHVASRFVSCKSPNRKYLLLFGLLFAVYKRVVHSLHLQFWVPMVNVVLGGNIYVERHKDVVGVISSHFYG